MIPAKPPKCVKNKEHDWYSMNDVEQSSTQYMEIMVCQNCFLIDQRTFVWTKHSFDRRNYKGKR